MNVVQNLRAAGFALGLAAVAIPAHAQAPSVAAPGAVSQPGAVRQGDFRISLGLGAALRPDYAGSRSQVGSLAPVVNVSWRDTVFLSTTGGLPSLGANLVNTGGWRAGPVVRLRFPREEKSNAVLRGMGNIDWTPEVGGFVDYRTGMFRFGGEVRHGVGNHGGIVGELRADAVLRPAAGLMVSFGPRMSFGDARFTQRYFGVDQQQAARTGYAIHRPGAGVTSVGAGAFASYALTSKLTLGAFAEYGRLQNGAANSPLVRGGRGDPNQFVTGLSLTYSFGL